MVHRRRGEWSCSRSGPKEDEPQFKNREGGRPTPPRHAGERGTTKQDRKKRSYSETPEELAPRLLLVRPSVNLQGEYSGHSRSLKCTYHSWSTLRQRKNILGHTESSHQKSLGLKTNLNNKLKREKHGKLGGKRENIMNKVKENKSGKPESWEI